MQNYSLSHLSDSALDHALESAALDDSRSTAWLLAHIAESDSRRRYADAGYPSMKDYCVRRLHFSEDAAEKRIRVARVARQFPAILLAIAERRLHLTAVLLLAPRLTPQNAEELLAAATRRSKAEVELLLAARFARPDLQERVEIVTTEIASGEPALERVEELSTATQEPPCEPVAARSRVTPLSPQRYGYQFTGDQRFHDDLERFRSLLGHQRGSTSVLETLHHALRLGIRQLEKRKCGATDRPRARRGGPSSNPRHIPAEVRRAVWERDEGRCTFLSDSGRRCEARDRLEFDHEIPVARGGTATATNIRLRCRTHNQLDGERVFGAKFMAGKREASRDATSERRRSIAEPTPTHATRDTAPAPTVPREVLSDVIKALRTLGYRDEQAKAAARLCELQPDAPLESQVRLALSYFLRPGQRRSAETRPAGGEGDRAA